MTLNQHVSNISKSVRHYVSNLSHIGNFLTSKSTELMVHSFISSRFDFCNAFLINLPEYQLNCLRRLQNSAARLVTLVKRTSHISPSYKHCTGSLFVKRIIFKVLLIIFHSLHGTSPTYIQDSINLHVSSRQLRSSNKLLLDIPRSKHSWRDRSYSHSGPFLWNSLPPRLSQADTCSTFKTNLKTNLFPKLL